MNANTIQLLTVSILPLIFAITLHEAAHGYVAKRFGDLTAYAQGRVTLNPIHHIDPIGTVLIPLLTLAMGGMLFGWAKPVPVNFGNLHKPKRDMLWVALAGPGANLVMAVLWALIAMAAPYLPAGRTFIYLNGLAGVEINIVFLVLNLIPIPPLDGSRVIESLLPPRLAWRFAQFGRYGLFVLLLLLMTGALNFIMMPFINALMQLFASMFGIHFGYL